MQNGGRDEDISSMIKKAILTLVCGLPGVLFSQYERPGSSSAEFLNIGVSARAEAMAGAYVSVPDAGAEVAHYNVAALARLRRTSVTFSHTDWFADMNHQFLAVALPIGLYNTIAFTVTALQTDEMIVRTPLQPDGTGETFYAGSYRFGIALARQLTDHVSVGVAANYVRVSLHQDFAENGFAGNFAVLYDTGVRNFSFGFQLSNFGSEIKFVNEAYPMPTNFSFGLSANAFKLTDQALLVSVSATKPNDGSPRGRVGGEYNYQDAVFLRAGYNIDDPVRSLALGAGLKFPLGSLGLRLDYSYNDFSLLGGAQRLSLGFQF